MLFFLVKKQSLNCKVNWISWKDVPIWNQYSQLSGMSCMIADLVSFQGTLFFISYIATTSTTHLHLHHGTRSRWMLTALLTRRLLKSWRMMITAATIVAGILLVEIPSYRYHTENHEDYPCYMHTSLQRPMHPNSFRHVHKWFLRWTLLRLHQLEIQTEQDHTICTW